MNSANTWLSQMSEDELLSMIPTSALQHLDNYDEAATTVLDDYSKGIDNRKRLKTKKDEEGKELTFTKKAWQALRREFYNLVCTDDTAYDTIRANLASTGRNGTLLAVATIAQELGTKLGIVAGPLVALVAILVHGALVAGRQAFCSTLKKEFDS